MPYFSLGSLGETYKERTDRLTAEVEARIKRLDDYIKRVEIGSPEWKAAFDAITKLTHALMELGFGHTTAIPPIIPVEQRAFPILIPPMVVGGKTVAQVPVVGPTIVVGSGMVNIPPKKPQPVPVSPGAKTQAQPITVGSVIKSPPVQPSTPPVEPPTIQIGDRVMGIAEALDWLERAIAFAEEDYPGIKTDDAKALLDKFRKLLAGGTIDIGILKDMLAQIKAMCERLAARWHEQRIAGKTPQWAKGFSNAVQKLVRTYKLPSWIRDFCGDPNTPKNAKEGVMRSAAVGSSPYEKVGK